MKKLLLMLLAAIAIFIIMPSGFTSCTKTVNNYDTTFITHDTTIVVNHDTTIAENGDTASSVYYVKATVDGVDVDYRYNDYALNGGIDAGDPAFAGTTYVYGFNNGNLATTDHIFIRFLIYSSGNPAEGATVGTYTDTAGAYSPHPYSGDFYLQLNGVDYGPVGVQFLSITQINSSTVSGTFTGTVILGDSSKTVTNGSFYVPF